MKIDGAKNIPTFEFDEVDGKLKIYGVSTSIDPKEFWDPIIETMKSYPEYPMDVELDINLEYFNTPAATRILALLRTIDVRMGEMKKILTVIWHDDDSEDMREAGEDLESMVNKNTRWVFKA